MKTFAKVTLMNIAATAFASGTVSAGPTPQIPVNPNHFNTVAEGIGFDSVPVAYDIAMPSKSSFLRTLDEVVRKNIEAALSGKNTNEEKLRALGDFIQGSLNRISKIING